MENGDLQVCFTDCSPATLLQVEAASGKVTVTPPNGPPLTLPSLHSRPTDFQSTESSPGPNHTWLWEALSQARRCQRKCAEAEARAVARNPPKTFPLVARSARLKSLLQRGGADATVALASAAPLAEVERAAELVAAVQSLHTSLLPANVSIASAQELSFASSSSSSSHLQTGPGYVPQQQYLHVPVLKQVFQKKGTHSPSSPLSPDPSLHSLPETPIARDGSSLGHAAERQPFSARVAGNEQPKASGNVAEFWSLEHQLPMHSGKEPRELSVRQEVLETAAEVRERERSVAFHSRGEEDHLRHVAADERRGAGAAEPPGSRSDGFQTSSIPQRVKRPPRPSNEELGFRDSGKEDESARHSERRAESGDVMGRGGRRQAEGPGRVLADVSNRQPLEVQTIRRAEKAKAGDGQGRRGGALDGVRRKTNRLESMGTDRLESRSADGEKERRLADRRVEIFKVFDDRAELDAHAAAMRQRLREGRHSSSQRGGEDVAGESRQANRSASDDPSLERSASQHRSERLHQELPPSRDARNLSDPASARSYSDTWQDLSGQNREPLSRPSASPSSILWQDVRPRDRLQEESAVCPDPSGKLEKQYPSREDARSYVASNHPANRRPPSNPLGPTSLNSSQSSYASLLPTSQPSSLNTGEFDDPSIGGASETRTRSKPPSHPKPNGAASLDSRHAERSSGRPEMGADGEKGRQSAYFPGVGWAIRLKSGELLMHYLDDCQVGTASKLEIRLLSLFSFSHRSSPDFHSYYVQNVQRASVTSQRKLISAQLELLLLPLLLSATPEALSFNVSWLATERLVLEMNSECCTS